MRAFGQKNTVLRKVVTWVAAMTLVLSMIPLMDFARAADGDSDACAHNWGEEVSETAPAICPEYTKTVYSHKCEVCGMEEITRTEGDIGHKQIEVLDRTTCTYIGKCEVCDTELFTREATHKPVSYYDSAATCEGTGSKGGKYCSDCGKVIEEPKIIPALGHKYVSDNNGKDATCTETGKTATETCTVCGDVKLSEVEPMVKHDLTFHPAKEAKCAQNDEDFVNGNYAYWSCDKCNKLFKDAEGKNETTLDKVTIEANHQFTKLDGTPANCTTPGLTDGFWCSECKKFFEGDAAQQAIQALGHAKETVFGYPATCTENGMTNGERCKRCGETIVAQEVIPATGHIYGNWIVDPANNNHYRICGNDTGHVEEADHVYGEWAITEAATIYASGRQQRVCTDCGHAEQAVVAKLAKATVRVQYVNEDGKILTTKHTLNLAKDSAYDMTDVANRIPAGYEADGEPYGDDLAGIADSDKTIYVPVKKVEVAETPEPAAPAATDNDATPVVAADDTDEGIADEETPLAAPEDEQTIADDENPMANSVQLVEVPALVDTSAASNGVAWGAGIAGAAVLGVGIVTLAGGAATTGAAASSAAASGSTVASRIRKKN